MIAEAESVETLTAELNEMTANIEAVVANAPTLGRSAFINLVSDDATVQDVDRECGYPSTSSLGIDLYYRPFYERHPIANRVVQVMPDECWKVCPEIFETEDEDQETEFEKAWKELTLTSLSKSKFQHKNGSQIWEYLRRVDMLSGIGHYGVLFLGLDDKQKDLSQPATKRKEQKLLFLRAFDEKDAQITAYESDPTNPRFGLPTQYSITFSSADDSQGIGATSVTKTVHWSRVIHVADNIGSNEVWGVPRMRPVFNRLWDLRKLYGGSGEMYWKGAFPGISIETHPHLGGAATVDTTGLRAAIQRYQAGLQRYLTLKGMAAKSLAPQVVDPSPQIVTQIEAICIQLNIPKRIFMGSERGELSSSQDKGAWNEAIESRQGTYLTPRVIVPFIDRLIELGVLPEPEEYFCEWPDLDALTEDEKTTVAIKRVHAMTKYVAGDIETIMSPLDFYTKILEMKPEAAVAILENALEAFEESETRDLQRDILEAKALRKFKQPAIGDDIKEKLLELDTAESTVDDALSDKMTASPGKERAEGNKSVRRLTSVKASSSGDVTGLDEDEHLT